MNIGERQKFIDFLDENDFSEIDTKQIPKEILDIFSGMANCLIFPFEKMCDLILQSPQATENFCSIAYNWLFMLNKMYIQQRFDLRNQYACVTANKLLKTPAKISAIPYVIEEHYVDNSCFWDECATDTPVGEFFAKKMAKEHRTIQQTFSELVFYFVYKMEEKTDAEFSLSRCNQEGLVSKFWHCPLV